MGYYKRHYSGKRNKIVKRSITFEEWLKKIHNLTYKDYLELNEYQQTALRLEFRGW